MGVFVGSFSAGVAGSLIDAAVSACEDEKWDEFLDESKLKISCKSSNSSQILANKLEASIGEPAAIGDPSNSLIVEENSNPPTDIISSPNGSSSASTSAPLKQQQSTENSEANLSENSEVNLSENSEVNLSEISEVNLNEISEVIPSENSEAIPSEDSKDLPLENSTDWEVQKSSGETQCGNEDWLQRAAEKDEQRSPCYERVCTEFYELPEVSAPARTAELSSIDEQLSTEGFNFNQDMYLNDWRSGWNGTDFPDWEMQEPLPATSQVHQLTSNSCLTTDRSLVQTNISCQDHDTMWHLSLVQTRPDGPSELARLNSVEVDSMAKCEIPTDGANFSSVFSQCPFSSSMIGIENPMSFNSTITIPLVSFKSRNAAYLEPQGSIVGFNSLNGSQEGNFSQGFCRKASMCSIAGAKPISRPGTPAATTRAARKSRMARKRRSMVQTPGRPGGTWSSQSPSRRSLSHIQSQQDDANTPEGSRVSISEKNLKFLLQKQLKPSDVGNLGRIVLPKKDAESRLPSLTVREGITIIMEDLMTSREWHLRYRFWPNNKSRMYLLENTGEFVKSHRLEEGDYMILYKDSLTAKYVICGKKASRMCGPGGMYLPSPDRTGSEGTSRAYGPSCLQGSETRSKKMKSLCESAPFDISKGVKAKVSTKEAHTNTFSGESSGSKPKRQKVDKMTTISEPEPNREVDDDSCLMQFKDDPLMEGIAKDFPAEFDGSELAQFPIIEPVDMAIEEMFSLVDMPTPESKSSKPCLSVS